MNKQFFRTFAQDFFPNRFLREDVIEKIINGDSLNKIYGSCHNEFVWITLTNAFSGITTKVDEDIAFECVVVSGAVMILRGVCAIIDNTNVVSKDLLDEAGFALKTLLLGPKMAREEFIRMNEAAEAESLRNAGNA